MSEMSHAEAVAFLRRCPDSVTIRLFRDSAVTPLSPLSPTEPESGLNRPRPLLRCVCVCVVSNRFFESLYAICGGKFSLQTRSSRPASRSSRSQARWFKRCLSSSSAFWISLFTPSTPFDQNTEP
jgi:hypothetical protein